MFVIIWNIIVDQSERSEISSPRAATSVAITTYVTSDSSDFTARSRSRLCLREEQITLNPRALTHQQACPRVASFSWIF